MPTLVPPWFWPWSLPTGMTFRLHLEPAPSLRTCRVMRTVSWSWNSPWDKWRWAGSQEPRHGRQRQRLCPTQAQIHSSQAGGAEQVQVLARSATQHLFCFKHEQHCLLASSKASEIQHLMGDGGQQRDLSHIKSHLYPALVLRSGHCTDFWPVDSFNSHMGTYLVERQKIMVIIYRRARHCVISYWGQN